MLTINPSPRVRASAFYEATLADGLASVTVYNHMVMPTSYGDHEAEYWRIINGVSMWDVSVQRQVQLQGPDAARLAQILIPRDLSRCAVGQGKYAPLCNHAGILINDPVLLKLDEDRFWLSLADGDVIYWAQAIAAERGLTVSVDEVEVAPMAIQGPDSEAVVASLCGDWIRELRYFAFRRDEIDGIPVIIARSGWSKQGGFEIYLMDWDAGGRLWNLVKEAGRPWHIGPGTPATSERTESGLLSYRTDTDSTTNPFEVRLRPYIDLDLADDVIGIEALRRIDAEGPRRHQCGVVLEGEKAEPSALRWLAIEAGGRSCGAMTHRVWSPRLRKNIGYALIETGCHIGDRVTILDGDRRVAATLCQLPFIGASG